MARVPPSIDAHRARRQQLLAGISAQLREIGIEAAFGVLEPYYDLSGVTPEGLTGFVVREPVGTGRTQVTVGGLVRTGPHGTGHLSADSCQCGLDIDYNPVGELTFEV